MEHSISALRTKESTADVLIIGAGPAGLMAANALNRAGVSVRIVDKRYESLLNPLSLFSVFV